MKTDFKSKALEANLEQTKQDSAELPEEHLWFLSLSENYWGIHKRTEKFIYEYNHPYPDYNFIVENLHTISLNDLWLYNSVEEPEKTLLFLVGFFEDLLYQGLPEKLHEQLVRTLFRLVDRLAKEEGYPHSVIWKCLWIIESCMEDFETVFLQNAGYFKMYLNKVAAVPDFQPEVCRITKSVLIRTCNYWEKTTNAESWFKSKAVLFQPVYREKIRVIGRDFFNDLAKNIERSGSWEEIKSNLFFDEIANHFRHFIEEFELSIEKIYYLVFLLHVPGMLHIKNHLLFDMNRLIKAALSELESRERASFIDMMFTLFTELKDEHTGTILDCQFTLGKEIAAIDDDKITTLFMERLIGFGFIYPGEIKITEEWSTKINPDHVKNIRIWLDLIKISPKKFKKLLSALVVNLKLGGIYISDTDLFQRDITNLLNADIETVFKQVKQLARLFPVYYSEIGAEGKLRDVSTAVDELSGRKDRLIHYLRKQIHSESNNMHVELVNRVAGFWYNGEIDAIAPFLPKDVVESIELEGEFFKDIHQLMQKVCQNFDVDYKKLLELPVSEVTDYILEEKTTPERDKKRLSYLIELNRLLLDKYSLKVRDVTGILRRSSFFSDEDIKELNNLLEKKKTRKALAKIYSFMKTLKDIILSKEQTEARESIYYKRHIAIGIPSMYGQYREEKFEALGLIYRLEQVASNLMGEILESFNMEYISAKTLNTIYTFLMKFKTGLELDGIVNQNFYSTLEMFRYSLTSASVTLGQYMNIFRFMSRNIREMINEYFMRVYDETIKVVTAQIHDNSREKYTNVSELFYRDILSSSFLIQELDSFLADLINMIDNLMENYSEEHIHNMMCYNPDLSVSSIVKVTPEIDNQVFLGAKAYYLKKLVQYKLPIPSGFVLTTEVYRHKNTILNQPQMITALEKAVYRNLKKLETSEGLKLGDAERPLLLSIRSGTAVSMPGAMSTFLNIGINDKVAEALSRNEATAWMGWDSYRRFIQSWGMSKGIDRDLFDEAINEFKSRYKIGQKSFFSATQMRELALKYKNILNDNGVFIADDPLQQLREAIVSVFESWSSDRARAYRQYMQIADEWGTAVIVQKMVMGNRSRSSGSGVVFTHDPKLKKPGINLYGDFTICSQGEDIVSGLVYTNPITESQRLDDYKGCELSLESAFPHIYNKMREIAVKLVDEYGFNHQEIEFTFESEKPEDLYILQIREQNIITKEETAIFDIPPEKMKRLGKGIGVGGGSISGIVSFDNEDLMHNKERFPDKKHILVRPDTVPDDIQTIFKCDGLVTSRGGVTSHAAVTAQKLGKVCIVNCKELVVNEQKRECRLNGSTIKSGDTISIDGNVGIIYEGEYKIVYL